MSIRRAWARAWPPLTLGLIAGALKDSAHETS